MRNISAPAPSLTRRKLYIAMVTATQLIWAGQAQASPEGGNVVGGAGNINQSGKETVIHQQTDRMAIDWQSFNVKADEHVQFIQPGASSIALNRVISNKGSEILGRIDANGQVFLVNPNGVVFGKDSQINVGGILASGLSINPTDFMNGNFTLSEVEGAAGKVVNSGIINAATGGSVTLLGKEVTNDGLIIANLGAVNLAVGKEAVVTFEKNGLVGVKVTKEVLQSELGVDASLINSGEINAEGGRILLTASTSQDIFSQAVNHEGMNASTSVVVNDDGSFTLGGGADVVNTGKLSTSVANGDAGQIVVVGDKVTNSGAISADSQTGNGGHIELNSKDTTILNQTASVSAQSTTSGKGGDVKVLGDKVGLMDTASVNTSGASGGGQVLIGGDKTGKNKSINNASFIYLGENTNVKTDALLNGDGGKLIAFAQDTARIYGNLSARGGIEGGNGGFIETSGLKGFEILNTPNTSALDGLAGTWLIDPYDLTIDDGPANEINLTNGVFESSASGSNLRTGVLENALKNNANIIVRTGVPVAPATTSQKGNISIDSDIDFNDVKNNTGTLTLEAASNIFVNANLIRNGSGNEKLNFILKANTANYTDANEGNIVFTAGKTIDTKGGNFIATGKNLTINSSGTTAISTANSDVATVGGDVSIDMTGDVIVAAQIVTGGGSFIVGKFNNNGVVNRVASFTGNDNNALINTSNDYGGGGIAIAASGEIKLGAVKFSYDYQKANAKQLKRVGGINLDSLGDVTLAKDIDFSNTGRRTNLGENAYANTLLDGQETTLLINAGNDININGKIGDSFGDGRDALDFNLTAGATGTITITKDIYTAGGNFTSQSGSFISSGRLLDTDNSNDYNGTYDHDNNGGTPQIPVPVIAAWSNGGNVTIKASQSVNLGAIRTDTASINTPSGGRGNLEIKKINASDNLEVKQTSSAVLNVFGTTTFDLFNNDVTNSSIALTNAGNLFSGSVFLKSTGNVSLVNNRATVLGSSQGSSNIKGTFDLTSAGDITQVGSLAVDGLTTIDAVGRSITLDNQNNNFGTVNFSNTISKLALKDQDDLTLGNFTATGGDVDISSVNGVLKVGDITNNFSAGKVTLLGGGQSGGIELSGNLTTKAGVIELKNNVELKNDVVIDTTGTSRGDILFGQVITSAAHKDLDLKGNKITFGGNVGDSSNYVGMLKVNATSDFSADANKRSFYATSFNIVAQNIYANLLNSHSGAITLKGTNSVTVNQISAEGISTNQSGGTVTIDGADITLGDSGNVAVNTSGNGGLAGDLTITATENGTPSITIKGDINSGTKVAELTLVGTGVTDGKVDLSSYSSTPGFTSSLLITGSSGEDTITGNSITNTWDLSAGTIKKTGTSTAPFITYTNFENVSGGSNADIFNVTVAFAGIIDGGNGANRFDIGADVTKIKSGSGDDTFYITTPNAITAVIEDSSTSDTDTLNADVTRSNNWILGGSTETLNLITASPASGITFSKVENLNGGGAVDRFKITGNRGGSIDAGADEDIVEVDSDVTIDFAQAGISGIQNAEVIQNTSGSAKKITVTSLVNSFIDWELSNFDGAGALADNSNDGEITVRGATPVKSIKFVDFSTLVGGNGNDTFKFIGAAKVDGLIDGAGGANNSLDLSSATGNRIIEVGTVLNGANLTVTGINSIAANNATTSTLLVSSATGSTNTWTISGTNSGLVNAITFTDFKNLIGGAGADIFDFSSVSNGGSVSGNIDGGTGSNTIKARVGVDNTWTMLSNTSGSLGETATPLTKYVNNFTSIQNFTGSNTGVNKMDFSTFSGDVKVELGTGVTGASLITSFVGNYTSTNGLNAELVGANSPNTWQITDANKGTVGIISFEGFNKLTGGSSNDNFTITNTGSFVGTIDGGTNGTDTLTRVGSVASSWVLDSAKAGSVDTVIFSNIDSITGSGLDSLTGRDQDNDWNISNAGSGTVRSSLSAADQVSFAGMSDLIGLTGKDNFTLKSTGSLTGKIDGGAGAAKNKLTNETAGATWTLDEVTTLSGKLNSQVFQNISDLVGSVAGTDTLIGRNQNNDWQILSANTGSVQKNGGTDLTTFTGIGNLTGNVKIDSFVIGDGAYIDGVIDGVGTNNKLTSNTANTTWVLDSATAFKGTLNGKTFLNIAEIAGVSGTLTGRDQANTWVISNADSGSVQATDTTISDKIVFSGMSDLNGKSFADNFSFDPSGSIAGILNGAGGENTVAGRTTQSIFAMNGANSGSLFNSSSARYAAFTNIQKLTGRSTADTLTGTNAASTWTFDSVTKLQIDNNSNYIEFSGFEKVQGGNAKDTFTFTSAFTGEADGGDGGDIFNVTSSVGNLLGGNGDDQFTIFANGKVASINGGGNTNTLTSPTGAANTWVLSAANKGSLNTFTSNAFVTSFESIQSLVGSGADSLKGINQANTWTIGGENKGTLEATDHSNTINFSGMSKLIGGTGADFFDFSKFNDSAITESVDGGGTSGDNNNTIKGRSAKNSWIIDSDTSGKIKVFGPNGQMYVKSFINIQNHETNNGDGIISDFWDISKNPPKDLTIEGTNSETSKIIGSNSNNSWNIFDSNTGSVTYTQGGQTFTVNFIGYSNLTGGKQDDQFNFSPGGNISGTITGGVGENSGAFNSIAGLKDTANAWQMIDTHSGAVTAAGAPTPYAKFQNIQKITGGNRVDTLYGIATGDSSTKQNWRLNNNGENIFFLSDVGDNMKFTNIKNIEGGVGVNTLINNAGDQNWLITDANHGAVGQIDFSKINVIVGNGSDTLTGRNQENNWQITGDGSGTLSQNNFIIDDTLVFSRMNKLVGGTGVDVFTFNETGTVQNVDGGGSTGDTDNTLVSISRGNSWIVEANGTSKLYAAGNTVASVNFTNISNLTGGAGFADLFDIANVSVVTGLIDGGAGINNTLDLTKISNGVGVKVGVGKSTSADVKIANITEVKANTANRNTLIADDIAGNIFTITGENLGTLGTMSFNGFANLTGRQYADTFIFKGKNAKISGVIDGGTYAGTDGASYIDILDLSLFEDVGNVAMFNGSSPKTGAVNIANVESVEGNDSFDNTFFANDRVNTWSIDGTNSGSISNDSISSPIEFTNFSILSGGQKDDLFTFSQAGKLDGYIDGGAHDVEDIVDLSNLTDIVEISLDTLSKGYRLIERFIGNNIDSTLYGDNNNNVWNLTGAGEGNINNSVFFSKFTSLVGGKGEDRFELTQGQLSGSISGGEGKDIFNISNAIIDGSLEGGIGDDTLNATISTSSAETIRFVGGEGANTVNVSGQAGDTNTYIATHGSAVVGGGVLRYDVNNSSHAIRYSNTTEVNDLLKADTLIVDGTDAADTFSLFNNSYLLNNFTTIKFDNKNNLVIAGATDDKVSISTPTNSNTNSLTIKKASVETTGAGLIRANSLILDGVIAAGSIDNRLQTNVGNLLINTAAGDIYIKEQSGLNLSGFNSNNKFDLLLDGNLTSDVELASIARFKVETTTGNIILDKNNALTGELNLKAPGNITLKNSTGTLFGNLNADTLNVDSVGAIQGNGIVKVGGLATLGSNSDIVFENALNDFNSVSVTRAQNVSLADSGLLTLSNVGATGDIKTQSQGIIVNGAVNGGSFIVNAGGGTANLANTVNSQANVDITAQNIIVAGNISAAGSVKVTSLGDFSQSANFSGGDIELNVGRYTTGSNVTTAATNGSVSITSTSDITSKNISATKDIILKAANDLNSGGVLSTSTGIIDLLAGRNLALSGDVNSQADANLTATNGSVQLQAALNSAKGNVNVTTAGDIVMAATAASSAAEGNISFAGKNLTITALNALNGEVIFNSSGSVNDGNAELTNISAKKFTVDAISGIGALDDIETNVAGLSLASQTNSIRIINTGEVTIDRMRANSNIYFSNYKGDVLLDNSANPVFGRTEPDALIAGGTMNSNYNLSDLFIRIDNGDLLMAPGYNKSKEMPAIVASNAKIDIAGGTFGSLAAPITVYVRGDFVYTASRYTRPVWAFGARPLNPVKGPGVQTSLIDLLSAGAEQLVVVEEINQINPAIFTNVRNYVYDDIAIMLPADQRYDDGSLSTN